VITTLAFRHLLVRKLRSVFLLLGFSLGVGVMIVLLSVGEAMVVQSRDVSLVGGGEITVLPQGIDVEAMRTGGLSGLFFGIDRARFLTRQLLGGERHAGLVRAVSPTIEGKLLYLRRGLSVVPVRAGGDIPSRTRALGAGLQLRAGRWDDSPADSGYILPTPQQLYDELDHFHVPIAADSSWGEWHYFNLVASPREWWYVTFLVGGALAASGQESGRWGGRILVTHRRPDGGYERFETKVPAERVVFDTTHADVRIGDSFVDQKNGTYRVLVRIPSAQLVLNLEIIPARNRYFPPVELKSEDFISGYVVPALSAAATGTICRVAHCSRVESAPAYHDHNWGVWREVTWEWGAATGSGLSLLYGGVYGPARESSEVPEGVTSPLFLTIWDSSGVKQVLRFSQVHYRGARRAAGRTEAQAPAAFQLLATRGSDSVQLGVQVVEALGTGMAAGGLRRTFFQMRGTFRITGRLLGQAVSDSGWGFFETYDRH
jgi:hypothetical protein